MVEIRAERTRDEIERDLSRQGFHVIFNEDEDEQIWVDKEQDELLFLSWINCQVQVYKLDRTEDL